MCLIYAYKYISNGYQLDVKSVIGEEISGLSHLIRVTADFGNNKEGSHLDRLLLQLLDVPIFQSRYLPNSRDNR